MSPGFVGTMRLCLKEKSLKVYQHVRFSDVFSSEKAILELQGYPFGYLLALHDDPKVAIVGPRNFQIL